ncbi:MAG: AbrB/MazE/SpoVT family DNA-binding domain-containing protein [Clostridia bacterium]|nr:AbrB/MazE/SpoVT family DNA-binding domain-containing protein [Clostridia bacterium]
MSVRKVLNIMFAKAGSGSITTRVTLPISWIKKMGLSPDNRQVTAEFDGKKITITKAD